MSEQLFCSSKDGGACLRCHRKSWLDRQSCLDKKKEKTGKEKKESASMSDRANGNVKNDEARKPRSSGFSQMN